MCVCVCFWGVHLFECEGLVFLKGLLRQRTELSDFLHALLLLLQQHALSVGHFLQLLCVVVDGIVLLLLYVLPSLHALYVVLDLCLRLVNQRVQIWGKHLRRWQLAFHLHIMWKICLFLKVIEISFLKSAGETTKLV